MRVKGFSQTWLAMERLRFRVEEITGKGKGGTTNGNGFGIELG
jgi:hypothetical protein